MRKKIVKQFQFSPNVIQVVYEDGSVGFKGVESNTTPAYSQMSEYESNTDTGTKNKDEIQSVLNSGEILSAAEKANLVLKLMGREE